MISVPGFAKPPSKTAIMWCAREVMWSQAVAREAMSSVRENDQLQEEQRYFSRELCQSHASEA